MTNMVYAYLYNGYDLQCRFIACCKFVTNRDGSHDLAKNNTLRNMCQTFYLFLMTKFSKYI